MGASNCSGSSEWQFPFPKNPPPDCQYNDTWPIQIFGKIFQKQNASSGFSSGFTWLCSRFHLETFFLLESVTLQINGTSREFQYDAPNRKKYNVTNYDCKNREDNSCYGCYESDLQDKENDITTYGDARNAGYILLYEQLQKSCKRTCDATPCSIQGAGNQCSTYYTYQPRLTGYGVQPQFASTCTIGTINGDVQDPTNGYIPWYANPSWFCRYFCGFQWQSKGLYNATSDKDKRKIDVVGHYTFDILPTSLQFVNTAVKSWEIDITSTNESSGASFGNEKTFQTILQFYMYIQWWVDLYYSVLYTLLNQQLFPYTQNEQYTYFLTRYVPSPLPTPLDKVKQFVNYIAQQPKPLYDTASKSYQLSMRMSFRLFTDAVVNQTRSDLNTRLSNYLSMYLQEHDTSLYQQGVSLPQSFARFEYVPNTLQHYAMDPMKLQYSVDAIDYNGNAIQNLPKPFHLFDQWYQTATPDDRFTPDAGSLIDAYIVGATHPEGQGIPFLICIEMKVRIQQWSAPLVAIMQPVIVQSNDLCAALFESTHVYPKACAQQPTDSVAYKQFVQNACTVQVITTVAMQSLFADRVAYMSSISNTCLCYNSGLMPSNLAEFANPVAMCFDIHCTDSDRNLVNATPSFCKTNCGTVTNWLDSKSQTHAQNPAALDTARYQQLCHVQTIPINWNVLGNGLGIVILVIILCIVFKRYWLCTFLTIPLLGVVIWLAYDLKLKSICSAAHIGPNETFECSTALTHIPMPRDYCDYRACQCLFNEDCPLTCTCASGICIPQIQGFKQLQTSERETVQWNVMGTCFIITLAIFCALISVKMVSLIGYSLWIILSIGMITVALTFLLIRIYRYTVYQGSCVIPTPLLCGFQSVIISSISLEVPVDIPRDNVLLASVATPGSPYIVTSNIVKPQDPTLPYSVYRIDESPLEPTDQLGYAVPSLGNTITLNPYTTQGMAKVDWNGTDDTVTIKFSSPFESIPIVIGTPYYLVDKAQQKQFVAFHLIDVTTTSFTCRLTDEKGQTLSSITAFSWIAIGELVMTTTTPFFHIVQTKSILASLDTSSLGPSTIPAIACLTNSLSSSVIATPFIYDLTPTRVEWACAFRDLSSSTTTWSFDLNDSRFTQNIAFTFMICTPMS